MGIVMAKGTNQECGFVKGANWARTHKVRRRVQTIVQILRETENFHCFDVEGLVTKNCNSLEETVKYIIRKFPPKKRGVWLIYFAHPMEGLQIPEESGKRALLARKLFGEGYEIFIPEEHQVGNEDQQDVDLKAVADCDILLVDFWRAGDTIV